MFKNLQDTVKALNADVNNVANSEKAKKLRKKLLLIGLPMAIGGFLGLFTCFALFALACFGAMGTENFLVKMMVPFLLFMPCGFVGMIGTSIASLGFKIVVTGYTTDLINETVGNNCPNCGQTIDPEMLFCGKCGARARKECPSCKHINSFKNDYCEKCGTKLD